MGVSNTHGARTAPATHPKSQPFNPTNLTPTDHTDVIESLYLGSYGFITSLCMESEDLTFADASMILDDLARQLHEYGGELTQTAFESWCSEVVKLPVAVYSMRRKYSKSVFAGIWSVLRSCTDLGIDSDTVQIIASDVWMWVLIDPRSPIIPDSGTGRTSTRLYGKARWMARAWKTKQLRDGAKFTTLEDSTGTEVKAATGGRTVPTLPEY